MKTSRKGFRLDDCKFFEQSSVPQRKTIHVIQGLPEALVKIDSVRKKSSEVIGRKKVDVDQISIELADAILCSDSLSLKDNSELNQLTNIPKEINLLVPDNKLKKNDKHEKKYDISSKEVNYDHDDHTFSWWDNPFKRFYLFFTESMFGLMDEKIGNDLEV